MNLPKSKEGAAEELFPVCTEERLPPETSETFCERPTFYRSCASRSMPSAMDTIARPVLSGSCVHRHKVAVELAHERDCNGGETYRRHDVKLTVVPPLAP